MSLDTSRIERALWVALLAVNIATHFVALDERSASHDESMHAFYSYELATKGEYRHDPMMHGPLLFHATALVFLLLGASDTTARLLPALAGLALLPAFFLYRRYLGRAGALLAAGLATISPSLLFYGRYLWSDVFLELVALLWLYGALRYLETRAARFLFVVAGALSVSLCAKETAFVSGLTFGSFFAVLCAFRVARGRERLRESPAGHLALVMLTLVLPFLTALVHVAAGWDPADFDGAAAQARALWLMPAALAVSAAIALGWSLRSGPLGLRFRTWLGLAGAFWALPLLLFTTLFTNVVRGLTSGVVGSLGYWLGQHDVARGSQPWFYYLMLAALYEPLALLAAAVGLAWLFRRRAPASDTERILLPALAWWACASAAAYSWAGEKMPWLLVHMALPLAVLAAPTLARAWSATDWPSLPRARAWALLALPLVAAGVLGPLLWLHPEGRGLQSAGDSTRVFTQLLVLAALAAAVWRVARPLPYRAIAALLSLGIAALLGAYTFRAALQLAFVNEDLPIELLVYAHGTPDIKRAMREVDEIAARTGQGDALEVAYDDDSTWPLNWYLRAYPKQRYLGEAPAPPGLLAPVVMIGSKNLEQAQPYLERDYVRRDYRLIWWPAEDYVASGPRGLLRALADPEARARLRRYLLQRETGYSLTEWPLRHEFTLFVRRDLVAQAWPLGFEQLSARPAEPDVRTMTCAEATSISGPFDGRPLSGPQAIAVGADGRRLVADTGGHRVVVLDRQDTFVRAFGSRCDLAQGAEGGCLDPDGDGPLGLGDGQLNEPWGIAAGPDGQTLVADTWNGRVVTFDAAGRFAGSWGRLSVGTAPPVPNDLLYGPRGIAYDAGRDVVAVSDTGHKRVLLFSRTGVLRTELGGPGTAPGRFDEPVGLAFGADGTLHVADAWNRRLQRFGAASGEQAESPVPGWGDRSIVDKPYVAVSRAGVVYASDPAGARILVYAPEGRLTGAFSVPGWSSAPRTRPAGLALDEPRKRLLVADPAKGSVWTIPLDGAAGEPCRGTPLP